MINVFETNSEYLYFAGDIHGEFEALKYQIKRNDIRNASIIVCGDIGIGFSRIEYYKQLFTKLSRLLSKNMVHIFFVRGNHDDPDYFSDCPFNFKYIHFVPDYSIIKVAGHNVLCVGGGISIDRTDRVITNKKLEREYLLYHKKVDGVKIPMTYWENEVPVYNEDALNEIRDNGIVIDAVCSHTSPSFCAPTTKGSLVHIWAKNDNKLLDDLAMERSVMDNVYNKLIADGHNLERWYYGHFHYHNMSEIDGVMYMMLDMCRNGILDMVELR